jgi:hypothetical protein
MKIATTALAVLLLSQATPPGASIHGRVLDDRGSPIPGAVVVAVGGPPVPGALSFITTETGTFTFDRLEAGRYVVSVAKPGYPTVTHGQVRPGGPGTPLELKTGQRLELPLTVPRGAAIEGVLVGPDGEPAGGSVVVVRESPASIASRKRWTPASAAAGGRFRTFGLAPGTYRIATTPPDDWPSDPADLPGVTLTVNAGDERDGLVLRVVPQSPKTYVTVSASAADGASLPFPEMRIRKPREMRRVFSSGRPNGDGSRTITDIPAGNYIAVVRSGDYWGSAPVSVDGEHPESVAVTLTRGAQLHGTFTTDTPLPSNSRISIGLHAADDAGLMDDSQAAFGRVAPDGTFVITGIPPGRYVISTLSSGPDDWMIGSARLADADVTDRPLTIGRDPILGVAVALTKHRATLKGVVSDSAGTGVPGLDVIAYPADPSRRSRSYSSVAVDRSAVTGEYELRGLPAGRYHLAVVEDADRELLRSPAVLAQLTPLATVDVGLGQVVVENLRLR